MLSSPLQWPLLVIGIAGLALQLRVALLAQREEDLTQASRLLAWARRAIWGASIALIGIDLAVAYSGGSSMAVGFFFLVGVAIWTITIWSPLILRARKERSLKGWPLDWKASNEHPGSQATGR